jgi:tRNA pseudouridine55 synthase
VIALGTETDTLDPTGRVTRSAGVPALDERAVCALTSQFSGTIEQTPPIFSALKRDGVPLYKLARRGSEVAPPRPRQVEIKRLQLAVEAPARLRFEVVCSPGMYVRSLARDLGVALGSAAHLAELRRLRNGAFSVEQAAPLAVALTRLERADRAGLIGLRDALPGLPEVVVETRVACRLRDGDARALDGLNPRGAGRFKVVTGGELLAIAEPTSRVTAAIGRIFNPV